MPGVAPGPDITEELMAFCAAHLARQKCPRSIDFEAELPRLPTGKLYKRLLRDHYSSALLASSAARDGWVTPDLAPFPWS